MVVLLQDYAREVFLDTLESIMKKKRVVIAHGWLAGPTYAWFPWLKQKLEERGFEVIIPELPDAKYPKLEKWLPALAEAVGVADGETYFVGHSMGCQAILRYMETLPVGVQVGGVVFVGGVYDNILGLRDGIPAREFYASWFSRPLDIPTIVSHMPKSVAIFSDNDKFVPLDNQNGYRDHLGSEIFIEHDKGHFTKLIDGVDEVPYVLEQVLKLSGQKDQ